MASVHRYHLGCATVRYCLPSSVRSSKALMKWFLAVSGDIHRKRTEFMFQLYRNAPCIFADNAKSTKVFKAFLEE